MALSDDDKEFLIRALAMHAVFTRSGGPGERPPLDQAAMIASWIGGFANDPCGNSDQKPAPAQPPQNSAGDSPSRPRSR